MTPAVADVVDASGSPLVFREPGGYTREALTSCGHNLVYLKAMKSDGSYAVEMHGVRVHCARCGALQSFGAAR